MDRRPSAAPGRAAARRCWVLLLSALLAVPLLPLGHAPAQAGPAPRTASPEQERVAQRERQALADLAESSAVVRAAAVALSGVAAELPVARSDVAKARGGLVGARARASAAAAALAQAEQARAAASREVDEADARVDRGRLEVGLMARRTYQRGRLGDLREVMEAGEPQDVLVRAGMLRSIFRHQDASLDRLTSARLALASRRAGLAAQERTVARARERAADREERARKIVDAAESAQARVASLVAVRATALRSAEGERAADQAGYRQAQAASQALAARIREAARRAAAEAARRRAAAAAAQRAAAAASARAAARAAEVAAAEQARRSAAARAARRRAVPALPPAAPAPPPPPPAPPAEVRRTGAMQWPCGGCPLTSTFGWRTHPIFGDARFHAGIDLGAPIGAPVRAADAGTVIVAGSAPGYGTLVVVSHGLVGGRDLSTAYGHLSTIGVSVGQQVARGERIGAVGNEGNSTGPHLHFEVRRNGEPVDPLQHVSPP